MSPDQEEIRARRKTSPVSFKWWRRDNTLEIAAWLAEHGVRSQVGFQAGGTHVLSVNGYVRDIPEGESGLWISDTGDTFSDNLLSAGWEIVGV